MSIDFPHLQKIVWSEPNYVLNSTQVKTGQISAGELVHQTNLVCFYWAIKRRSLSDRLHEKCAAFRMWVLDNFRNAQPLPLSELLMYTHPVRKHIRPRHPHKTHKPHFHRSTCNRSHPSVLLWKVPVSYRGSYFRL